MRITETLTINTNFHYRVVLPNKVTLIRTQNSSKRALIIFARQN